MMVVMKMKKQLTRAIAAGLDVPSETLCNQPVVTFRGKEDVTVENHRGIIGYADDLIQIAVKPGSIMIRGRDLTIIHMSRRCLRIKGTITCIEMG